MISEERLAEIAERVRLFPSGDTLIDSLVPAASDREQSEMAKRLRSRFLIERGKTHWVGCWRDHYECAMRRIVELEDERETILGQAARAVCGYCAGTKGHNAQPVRMGGDWWHLFLEGNGRNRCGAGALWDWIERDGHERG